MNLYNAVHKFQITTKDNLKVGDYIIDLDSGEFDKEFYILKVTEIDDTLFCASICSKVNKNNTIKKYIGVNYNDEYSIGNAWHVIISKEYYHMIDKVLVFS